MWVCQPLRLYGSARAILFLFSGDFYYSGGLFFSFHFTSKASHSGLFTLRNLHRYKEGEEIRERETKTAFPDSIDYFLTIFRSPPSLGAHPPIPSVYQFLCTNPPRRGSTHHSYSRPSRHHPPLRHHGHAKRHPQSPQRDRHNHHLDHQPP